MTTLQDLIIKVLMNVAAFVGRITTTQIIVDTSAKDAEMQLNLTEIAGIKKMVIENKRTLIHRNRIGGAGILFLFEFSTRW